MSLCIKSQIDAFANQGSQTYISSFQFIDRKEGKQETEEGRKGRTERETKKEKVRE